MENSESRKLELDTLQSQFTHHQAIVADMEIMIQSVTKKFAQIIVEAREEIAVKVAQVKQYQKQVEAYKQQVFCEEGVWPLIYAVHFCTCRLISSLDSVRNCSQRYMCNAVFPGLGACTCYL